MINFSVIVQGEGKGHFSQALALVSTLEHEKTQIQCLYLGRSLFKRTPGYFKRSANLPVKTFFSPNFINTADNKGIQVFFSILLNLVVSPLYIFEMFRLALMLRSDGCRYVFNHYDPVGALAAKMLGKRVLHVMISHHFYLSHPDFIHPHGVERSFFLLQWLNYLMMKLSKRVFALSFRKGARFRKIEVIPPLINHRIIANTYHPGERDLCYFLNDGYISDLLNYYRRNSELKADIFVKEMFNIQVPENVILHVFSREKFIDLMLHCRRIITSAGFDTAAEAFYLGIPVFMLPVENHYEQYCNAIDAARTGMAYHLDRIDELDEAEFCSTGNGKYKKWVQGFDVRLLIETTKT